MHGVYVICHSRLESTLISWCIYVLHYLVFSIVHIIRFLTIYIQAPQLRLLEVVAVQISNPTLLQKVGRSAVSLVVIAPIAGLHEDSRLK